MLLFYSSFVLRARMLCCDFITFNVDAFCGWDCEIGGCLAALEHCISHIRRSMSHTFLLYDTCLVSFQKCKLQMESQSKAAAFPRHHGALCKPTTNDEPHTYLPPFFLPLHHIIIITSSREKNTEVTDTNDDPNPRHPHHRRRSRRSGRRRPPPRTHPLGRLHRRRT